MEHTIKNKSWLIAGALNLFTALLHLIGGQMTLVNPLLGTAMTDQAKTEWLGAWHIVSVVLVVTSYYLIKYGLDTSHKSSTEITRLIGILYILFAVVFILSSISMKVFAPQWILLLPIGILAYKK